MVLGRALLPRLGLFSCFFFFYVFPISYLWHSLVSYMVVKVCGGVNAFARFLIFALENSFE